MDFNQYKEKEQKRLEIAIKHLENGVDFVDINTAYIDEGVTIGRGTLIGPCVTIEGDTAIGENCRILQNSRIKDAKIEDDVEIQTSVVLESQVGAKSKVGPFAYLRPKSIIGKECKVGGFCGSEEFVLWGRFKSISFDLHWGFRRGQGCQYRLRRRICQLRRQPETSFNCRGWSFYRMQHESGISSKG